MKGMPGQNPYEKKVWCHYMHFPYSNLSGHLPQSSEQHLNLMRVERNLEQHDVRFSGVETIEYDESRPGDLSGTCKEFESKAICIVHDVPRR